MLGAAYLRCSATFVRVRIAVALYSMKWPGTHTALGADMHGAGQQRLSLPCSTGRCLLWVAGDSTGHAAPQAHCCLFCGAKSGPPNAPAGHATSDAQNACCLQDADESCNVIHMSESFYFRNHLCISFELLNVNLYEFIKNNNFSPLSLGLIK